MNRRGRPPRDRVELFADVAVRWAADPDVSGSALSLQVHARKQDVLECLRALADAQRRFPNPHSARGAT